MWQINTYGNGDVLSDVFRSIVFLMGGGYESLLRLGMVCLVFGAIAAFLARGRIHWQWVMGAIVILAVTINIRTTVLVHDLVNPGVADQIIDNVPLAVSFPAYMTSEISYQTMVGVETAFGLPAQYRVVNSTIGKGFFDMQKTMGLELIPGDLQANVTNYLKDCVFRAIELNQLNRETILDAANMATAIQVDNAALVTMEIRLGNPFAEMTCPAMYDQYITNGLVDGQVDYDETMKQFRAALGEQNIADAELTPVQTFANNIMGTAQDPRVIINNVLLRERWKDAEKLEAEDGNDTSSAVVQMTKSISEDLKNQAYNDSLLAARFVPLIRTVSESVIYLLTPLMLALAMSPAMFATIRGVVMSYGWLFMWIPMYAIFNFVTFQYGVQQMNLISVNQLTFNSYDQYLDVLLGLNTFMGRLIWAVPTLATVVTYGMSSMASALSGAAGGAQAAATQEASAYAHGQGSYIEPGQHLKEQELPMVQDVSGGFHAGATYFGGGTGTSIHRQDGSAIVSYGDGSSLHISRDGITQQYHGPEGSWSKHGDVYEAGVWRQEVRDADGQTHLAQFEVSGDHVDVSYMKQDGHGVQHDIRETWNQSMNEQKSVSDTWADKGFTHQLTTLGDHSQHMKTVGTSTVPVTRNGKTEMITADITASFSRSSPNEPWGAGVMTAHSTEHGEHRYALSDVQFDDRGLPDLSKGMTVTSSDGTKLHTERDSEHGLFITNTEGQAGELSRTYSGAPANGVEVFHGDGTHERMTGVVSGQGGVAADGTGLPFQASFTTDMDGYRGDIRGEMSYNAEAKRWELHTSDEEWSARLEAQSSGMMMQVGNLELLGGSLKKLGGRHGNNWVYDGPVQDGSNLVSKGHVESKDGQVYFSDLDHGSSQRVVGDGGHQLMLKQKPGSNDYTYEESWTGLAFREDSQGNLEAIGQTHFTSRGHAALDPDKEGSVFDRLVKTPDTTVAENKSAFGERSMAVSVTERPLSELPVGQGALSVDGQAGIERGPLHGGDGTGYVVRVGAGHVKENEVVHSGSDLKNGRSFLYRETGDGQRMSGQVESGTRFDLPMSVTNPRSGQQEKVWASGAFDNDGHIRYGMVTNEVSGSMMFGERGKDGRWVPTQVISHESSDGGWSISNVSQIGKEDTLEAGKVAHRQVGTSDGQRVVGRESIESGTNEQRFEGFFESYAGINAQEFNQHAKIGVLSVPDPMTPGHSKFVAGKAMFDPKSGAFVAGHWEEGESGRIFVGKNVDGAIKWGVMNYSSAEKGGERHTVSDFTAVSHENIPTNGIEMTAAFDSHTGRQLNLVGKGGTDVHIKDNYVEEHRRSIDVDRGFLQMPGSDPSHMTDGQRGVLALEEGVKQGMDAVRDLAFGKRNFESLIGGNGGGGGEGASRSPSPSGPRGETDRITEALQREVQDWQRRNGRGEGNGNRGRGRRRR